MPSLTLPPRMPTTLTSMSSPIIMLSSRRRDRTSISPSFPPKSTPFCPWVLVRVPSGESNLKSIMTRDICQWLMLIQKGGYRCWESNRSTAIGTVSIYRPFLSLTEGGISSTEEKLSRVGGRFSGRHEEPSPSPMIQMLPVTSEGAYRFRHRTALPRSAEVSKAM